MIKNVVVFWLWYQWKQFLRYFLKKNYNVFGICKTENTKNEMKKKFNIQVFTDYKKILNEKIDLLVLTAYPIDIYEDVIEYSHKFNYKILSDLPISFSQSFFKKYFPSKQIFLFHLETKLFLFKFIQKNIEKISKVEWFLLCNDYNISNKNWVLVDEQYLLNNLLLIDLSQIYIKRIFVKREIKNVEYLIKIYLKDIIVLYKYEENAWKIIIYNENKKILIDKNILFHYDDLIEKYISDIKKNNNSFQKEYIEKFIFLLKKYA